MESFKLFFVLMECTLLVVSLIVGISSGENVELLSCGMIALGVGSSSYESNQYAVNRVQRDEPERGCHCEQKQCSCCARIRIKEVKLDDTACIAVNWIPEQLAASAKITFGDKTVYDQTFSAHDPPSICFGLPGLKKHADICINFHDVQIESNKLHACTKLEAKLFRVKVGSFDFGCFDTKI